MDVLEAIRARRSVRQWADKPVEDEKLERILEAARLAPSARNLQNWKFIVVRNPATRAKLVDVAKNQTFVGDAPVVIAACASNLDYQMTCGQYPSSIDTAIAVEHMVLQATAEGLGTCWIGAFFEEEARALLGVPEEARVIALLPIGYPESAVHARPRKEMSEVVSTDRW